MRKFLKGIAVALCAITLMSNSTEVYAASKTDCMVLANCCSSCNEYMGTASLVGKWEYSDGSWVELENYSVLFIANEDYNYSCVFSNFSASAGVSFDEAPVQCMYNATDGVCTEAGRLYINCDTYGDTNTEQMVYLRRCKH